MTPEIVSYGVPLRSAYLSLPQVQEEGMFKIITQVEANSYEKAVLYEGKIPLC